MKSFKNFRYKRQIPRQLSIPPKVVYFRTLIQKFNFIPTLLFLRDLIKNLLQSDPTKRLGNLDGSVEDIKNHKWFKAIIWDDFVKMKIKVIKICYRNLSFSNNYNLQNYP